MIHKTKAHSKAIPHMNRKFLPRQFPRAPQTLLPFLYLLPWLKMPLEIAFDFLNALHMWILKKLRVSIVDSGEHLSWELWEYKQINVIQSVPSFHSSLTGSSHKSNEGHSLAISKQRSPMDWVCLVSIYQPTLHSIPFCSLGGCLCGSHHSNWLALWFPLGLANDRHWQEIRGWEEKALLEVSFSALHSSLHPLSSQAQMCSDCSLWQKVTDPFWWDISPESSSSWYFLVTPAYPPSDHEGNCIISCWHQSLSPSLGSWLNLTHTFFLKYPL